VCVCVDEIISLLWFSKELKMTYRITTGFVASSLYFSFVNLYSLGEGFPFTIVLVPRYKLSLCHPPIKPDLLGFPGIDVFACGLRDHVITRFASPWFFKELKTTYRRTGFVASSLYFSFANQYLLGGGFSFPIVLVPRYKLSLCHPPIKPDLLGFPGIDVFACGLRDHVITRFASYLITREHVVTQPVLNKVRSTTLMVALIPYSLGRSILYALSLILSKT